MSKTLHRIFLACAGLALLPGARAADRAAALKSDLLGQIDQMKTQAQIMNDTIFSFAELGFQEWESSKYLSGKAPEGSRGHGNENWEKKMLTPANVAALNQLAAIAGRKSIPLSQLALAWILKHPEITSCITGATRPEQVEENAAASEVEITDEEMKAIEGILQEKQRTG